MTATQVDLTERGENVVTSKKIKKIKKKGLHLESDSYFLHFLLKFVTITQEGSSLLKSSAHRYFSFTRDNLQAFATLFWVATHGLRNTVIELLVKIK